MSQTTVKLQASYSGDYLAVHNGSIVLNRGMATLPSNFDKSIVLPSLNRTPVTATKPISIPVGSGVYLL